MPHEIDIAQAAVYVGTYRKYNEGSLFGKWMNLSDYSDKDEFYKACKKLHKNEKDPEYMFQDYENIPESLINESWISDNFFTVRDSILEMEQQEIEPFFIWCSNDHKDLSKEDIEDLIACFQSDYVGKYKDDEDFAFELIGERTDLDEFAKRYFDYGAYARDLFCSDYWSEDGYVFYNS